MTLLQYVYIYVLTIPVFFVIDMLWLGLIANSFYQSKLAHLLGPVNWPAAIGFYLVYIVGILIFAVIPALEVGSLQKAIIWGVLFGFFTYATYDFTNLATLKDWPIMVVAVDVVWGAFLSGSVAAISYYLAKTFVI
ncbi:DUF2177 family protein [Candidatus Pacebacteria bacterium]|nr:DUF2177 family protein [Candidatus Paceibacterota bacterium]